MSKPKVMILLTCEDGHQVEVYPDKVVKLIHTPQSSGEDVVRFEWECPRCERPKENCVYLD